MSLPTLAPAITQLLLSRNEQTDARTLRIELGPDARVEFYGRNGKANILAGRIEHRQALAGLIEHYHGWLCGGEQPALPAKLVALSGGRLQWVETPDQAQQLAGLQALVGKVCAAVRGSGRH